MEILEILYAVRFAFRKEIRSVSWFATGDGNNILPSPYLIGGSCLSRIILVKNSRSLKARPFRTRSIVLYIRRVPYMARNSHFHKSRAPSLGSPDRIFYHSAISPRTISRAYPRTLNEATMHRSMDIIHRRQCFIGPAALSSLVMFRHGRALILKSCLAFYSLKRHRVTTVVALLRAVIWTYYWH